MSKKIINRTITWEKDKKAKKKKTQTLKKKNEHWAGHFRPQRSSYFTPIFSPIWGDWLLVGLKRKMSSPTIFFSHFHFQPNIFLSIHFLSPIFYPSSFHPESIELLGFVSLTGWKSRKIENEKMIEMWKDERNLVFSYICLDGRIKKLRDEKLICLIKKKNERIKNRFCTNLPLW